MKDKVRQIAVIVSIVLTIVVNTLANVLPLNGQNTGEISDRFDVYFTPAGYVFSIWGLIYIGLIAYAIFQALPSQRENSRLRAIGWWVVVGGLANSAWIFLWHYEFFPLTIVAMLILLATLIITYLRLGVNRVKVPTGEKLAVHLTFSVYLGWITVATVANVTSLLDYLKWNGFGISEVAWMWIILAAVLVIAVLMNFTRRDIGYALVILWALAGIGLKQAAVPGVATPAWIVFALVALTLIIAMVKKQPAAKEETPV
jgi:hypothetical protein